MKDQRRKHWNEQQKKLRLLLNSPDGVNDGIALFLQQHGMLHSKEIVPNVAYHFQEELLDQFPRDLWRTILPKGEHSIVWVFWHVTRIEDATLSMLVAGEDPLFERENWQEKLEISFTDTGNSMSQEEITRLSDEVDIDELMAYRVSVARHTREIVELLPVEMLRDKVAVAQIQRMPTLGVVRPSDQGLLDYWGGLTKAGVLLMPPTRHTFVHINEIQTLKEKILRFSGKQKD
jgi:hypothetical protein